MGTIEKVLIASDHAGFALKEWIKNNIKDYNFEDLGPLSDSSEDYPDYAHKLSKAIQDGRADRGILVCGSGVGMSMAANRSQGVRAALVENPVSARLSREHNHSNVLCLGSRFIAPEYAAEIIRVWMTTPESQEPRHLDRIQKIEPEAQA